ncbi:MAG: glycoside hydrolase family 13 protein [Lachnospiraceae bacterium]|nr:glycoside hydrolase family 13 protein [Lachnospiraceae bacterium]
MAEGNFAKLNQYYIAGMRPILRKQALYSDITENYVTPSQPSAYEKVKIRLRGAAYNIDTVWLVSGTEKYYMTLDARDELFDYFAADVQMDNELFAYYFEIHVGNITVIFDTRGVVKSVDEHFKFKIIPGFSTPKWAQGAVMYQIFVDRFCNGDPSNDVQTDEYSYIGEHTRHVEEWSKYPASMDVREFYGGDLQGVLNKMDYLQNLGVEVIYFNPLFVSPSNHKYDIQDYDNIDPHFGVIAEEKGELLNEGDKDNTHATRYINRVTNPANLEASNALFAKVVEEAHKRGIRVILDGVFNHCGSFNKWLDRERIYENAEGYEKGAYVDEKSPYHDFFRFHDAQSGKWPYNSTYDGWWGHDTLPKLNYEGSQDLHDYILRIAKKWVSPPYNADGWRLDVAADLGHSTEYNHKFWQDFRKAVKEANPDALILAEHYGSPAAWLQGNEWDTVMNYDAFMEPITWFLTGMQKHSDDFRKDQLNNASNFWAAMMYHASDMTMQSLQLTMNELSNHDHSRFLTRTNRRVGRTATAGPEAAEQGINKAVMREAVLFQFTWIGAPTIYYGDEAGLCGWTDPDNRRTYPWGNEDQEMIAFHKKMISIRKRYHEFKYGSIAVLASEPGIIGFGRFDREGQSAVFLNNNDEEVTREFTLWQLGIRKNATLKLIMITTEEGFDDSREEYWMENGRIQVTLPKHSAIILRHGGDGGLCFGGHTE